LNGFVGAFFLWQLLSAFYGSYRPSGSVDLEFPLRKGEFYILHGGSHHIINHHYSVSAQRYALDILQLNNWGFRSSRLIPQKLSDFNIYGADVYSPCDGTVIAALDQYPDQEIASMDSQHPAGNYIAVAKKESNVVVILAHLMRGSLTIKQGDVVQIGQLLGKVGNSGNTSEPHLHMHAVLNYTGNLLFTGKGVAMIFKDQFLVRNDTIH
jgi:hypothetical protein